MELERRSIRIGLAAIACAVIFRLVSTGAFAPVVEWLNREEVASFLIYMETGRVVRTASASELLPVPETTAATEPTAPQTEYPYFSEQDAQLVDVSNLNNYSLDIPAMLQTPLTWDLTQDEPAVLILHSHATESYTATAGEPYAESSAFRTLDEQHNMVRIGQQLAQTLRDGGIGVIHDTTFHDHPSYNDSYSNARDAIQTYLEQYPSIRMVLDIHRDAAELSSSVQLSTDATVNGQPCAQLMMVVGTNAGGLNHPNWPENMALAVKLHAHLEKRYPGICRPISFRAQRFNQDLSTGAMLIEVGAAGDTLEEALLAAQVLGESLLALAQGTATSDSTS